METTPRKLALNKETVRLLTEAESHTVVGGTGDVTDESLHFGALTSLFGSLCRDRGISAFLCFSF